MSKQIGDLASFNLFIFDLDGTIYELDGSSFDESTLGCKIGENKKEFILQKGYDPEEVLPEIREKYGEDTSIGLEKELGISKKEYFRNVWNISPNECISSYPKNLSTKLNKMPGKVVVLTNSPKIWADQVIDYLGIEGVIDSVFYGDETPKPDPRAFKEVLEFYGIEKEDAVIIGDQDTDIRPAKNLGLKTVAIGSPGNSNPDIKLDKLDMLFEAID